MKLEDYSLDDLHQMACAEFEGDDDAQRLLNSHYEAVQAHYIEWFKLIRLKRERRSREQAG